MEIVENNGFDDKVKEFGFEAMRIGIKTIRGAMALGYSAEEAIDILEGIIDE